tara:strand:+ start:217 stop:387 length:171 start_codon:yes stop_codon:yes gene_type:complete
MTIEYNKKYLIGGMAVITISIAVLNLFKIVQIPSLPCNNISKEVEDIDENNNTDTI